MLALEYRKPVFSEIFKDFKYGQHILILGSTESGKTNFLIWLCLNLDKKLVIFNPLGHIEFERIADLVIDFKEIQGMDFDKILNDVNIQKICISANECSDFDYLKSVWNTICKKIFFHQDVLYTEMMMNKGKILGKDFKRKSNVVLLNDEMIVCMDKEDLVPNEQVIIHMGRNYGISHIGNTQRNQNISKFITTQSKWKVMFEMDRYDTYVLSKKISNIGMVENLLPYHFIVQKGNDKPIFYRPLPLLKVD